MLRVERITPHALVNFVASLCNMDISLLSGSMELELDAVALYILMFLIDCFTLRIHPFLFLRVSFICREQYLMAYEKKKIPVPLLILFQPYMAPDIFYLTYFLFCQPASCFLKVQDPQLL